MLTRFVRIQLAIFTILSIVGVSTMVFRYIQAPTLLGVGRITITLELRPAAACTASAMSRTADAGWQGHRHQSGKRKAGTARLSLDSSARVPANTELRSAVSQRSVSSTSTCNPTVNRVRTCVVDR